MSDLKLNNGDKRPDIFIDFERGARSPAPNARDYARCTTPSATLELLLQLSKRWLKNWIAWAEGYNLPEMEKLTKMIRSHLGGIIGAYGRK